MNSGSTARDDLGGFGNWCFNWLRDHADFLKAGQDDSFEVLFGRILGAIANFDGMHAGTLALAQARQELSELVALKTYIQQRSLAKKSLLIRLLQVLFKSSQ